MLGNVAMCNTWWLLPSVFSHQNESHVICICHVVIFQCNKIAGEDMLFWQCAVMEFLVKQEIPASHVHTWLQHAYGGARIGTQPRLVAWKLPIPRQIKEKSNSLSERINVWQGNGSRDWNRASCSPQKVCACWVPDLLTKEHRLQWKKMFRHNC